LRIVETQSRMKSTSCARCNAKRTGATVARSRSCSRIPKGGSSASKRSARFGQSPGTSAPRLLPKQGRTRNPDALGQCWRSAAPESAPPCGGLRRSRDRR
jgi:hypothetical protein